MTRRTLRVLSRPLRALPLAAALALVPVITGCSGGGSRGGGSTTDFGTTINQIRPGASEDVVERELGRPDEKRRGVAGAQPTGPQPPVTIDAGRSNEQWVYRRGDSEYHVFMGPSLRRSGELEVRSVSANPAGASALQR